jgi:GNAT superfamily N-acetyltransferase
LTGPVVAVHDLAMALAARSRDQRRCQPVETGVESPQLIFEPFPGGALTNFLSDNVVRVNIARTGVSNWHPVGYFLKDSRGEYLAGLTGYIWGGWMHVDWLWVMEILRGRGYGSQLMHAAEAYAVERGATGAALETHSFGAGDFYTKRGYEIFGQLADYPPGHTKLFMRKRL